MAATGKLFGTGPNRGVYRSLDGGQTWDRVFALTDSTACTDLAMHPTDPDILYAAMWQFRRYPDFFTSGGPGSALYRSTDGGESWTELTDGLPDGEKGRIAEA